MSALRTLGHPYTDEEIAGSVDCVKGKTEMDAVVAYLQVLGTARSATMAALHVRCRRCRLLRSKPKPSKELRHGHQ